MGAPARRRGGYTLFSKAMIPEVFECPRCERQFVIDSVPDTGSEDVHCPQCSRFLGVRDIAFVLRSELDEMIERLSFEKDRLEKDEAVYSLTDCDPEMRYYGREVPRLIQVLRGALKDLRTLRDGYKVKPE
jgi:DNA-directed RNA polymerase subunit RPC12/RpoP